MSWLLPVLGAWVLLAAPGVALLRAVGARVPVPWGVAPVVTVLLIVGLGGLFHVLRIPWGLATVLPAMVIAGTLALLSRRALLRNNERGAGRRHLEAEHGAARRREEDARRHTNTVVTVAGVLGGLAVVVSATRRMGGISTLNGSYDSFFHLSAIATIRDGGDAFLTTALIDIYGAPTYYPVVFDALAALLPLDPISAANALLLALLAAWPAAVGSMVVALGPSGPTSAASAVISVAASTLFLSIPAMALVMGLWPVVLGALCLPVAIASALRLYGAREGGLGPVGAAGHGALILGTALAHPSMLFSAAVVVGLRLLVGGLQQVLRGRVRRGGVQMTVALVAAATFVALSWQVLDGMAMTRPSRDGLVEVLRQILVDSPRIPAIEAPLWPFAAVWALALVGAVAALRGREVTGLTATAGVVATVGLGMLTQVDSPFAAAVVNPWYGARERIAPLMACLMLVLLARGLRALTEAGKDRVGALLAPTAALLVLVTAAAGAFAPSRLPLMGSLAYTAYGLQLSPYVTPAERAFIERTAAELPPAAVVLADPLDGAPLYWSIGGVETVFPTMSQPLTPEGALLARYAPRVDDPGAGSHLEICEAAERIGATHLYRDSSEHNGRAMNPQVSARWSGVHDIPPHRLTPVAEEGPYALYTLDLAC